MEIMGFDWRERKRVGDGKGWLEREIEASWKALRRCLSAVKTAPEVVKTAKRMKEPWSSRI